MFDIGGWEFLVIVVVALVVIGPKDLPVAIKAVTTWMRKARALARDFQSGLDEIAREAELEKVEQEIKSKMSLDEFRDSANSIRRDIEDQVDPDDEIKRSFEDTRHFFDDPEHDFDVDPDEDEAAVRRKLAERRQKLADERAEAVGEKPDRAGGGEESAGENTPEPRAKTGS